MQTLILTALLSVIVLTALRLVERHSTRREHALKDH